MQKIITITTNNKTYNPSETQKQTSLSVNAVAYSPSLTEKIIGNNFEGFILSNLNKYLLTNNNNFITYGE